MRNICNLNQKLKTVCNFFKTIGKIKLFYFSTLSIIFGMSLIGLGLGVAFQFKENKCAVGMLIGTGVGLLIASIIAYKIMKLLMIYNKEKL